MVKPELDEVGKAAKAVRRGIDRLIALLGDGDRLIREGAAMALVGLGADAIVGPLVAALPRAREPRHRIAIAGALFNYSAERNAEVAGALSNALGRERDPMVSARLGWALSHVIATGLVSSMKGPDPVPGDGPA